ncbi:MAG: transposase, partial [Solobacterium sp.]|nr:transposase [Solobacterium sp.]MBR3358464.1 transposase [Solobacterium sp.]
IRQCFSEQLKPYYWKPYFWSLSYFIGTVSDKTTAVVKHYIQHQKD